MLRKFGLLLGARAWRPSRHAPGASVRTFFRAVAFSAVGLAGCGFRSAQPQQSPTSEKAKGEPVRSIGLDASMTETEFEEFQRQRDRYRQLPWFRQAGPNTHATQEQLRVSRQKSSRSLRSGVVVELPDRLVTFDARHVVVDFHDDDTKHLFRRLPEAFPHFPEIRFLYFKNYEDEPHWIDVLRGSYSLTNLSSIGFAGGMLSPDEVAVVAGHPFLKAIGASHIASRDFEQLARLTSLEMISLCSGPSASPECFLTLSELPNFHAIRLDGDDAFNVPISDDVRRAIESLDGRLQEVVTEWTLKVHPSVVRALVKVKSLKVLEIGSVAPGLRLADIEPLADLEKLRHFNLTLDPNDPDLDPAENEKMGALIVHTNRRALERWKQTPRETGYLR